jgi:hypothetical protein
MLTFCRQVIYRPTIGRFTKLDEPTARESLISPSAKTTSGSSSDTVVVSSPSSTLGASSINDNDPSSASVFSPMPHLKAVNAAFMERTPFAIDDAGDDDDDSDLDMVHGEDDDQVMDEVSGFLHLSIVHDAQCRRWMPFWRHMIQDLLKQTRRWQRVRNQVSVVYLTSDHVQSNPDLLHAEPVK